MLAFCQVGQQNFPVMTKHIQNCELTCIWFVFVHNQILRTKTLSSFVSNNLQV